MIRDEVVNFREIGNVNKGSGAEFCVVCQKKGVIASLDCQFSDDALVLVGIRDSVGLG